MEEGGSLLKPGIEGGEVIYCEVVLQPCVKTLHNRWIISERCFWTGTILLHDITVTSRNIHKVCLEIVMGLVVEIISQEPLGMAWFYYMLFGQVHLLLACPERVVEHPGQSAVRPRPHLGTLVTGEGG